MTEKFQNETPEGSPELGLVIDPEKRTLLVESLRMNTENAEMMMMDEMMNSLEAQVRGNSAQEMSALFSLQAAIYFDAGLDVAGISALNDAHIYAHNRKDEELAQMIRDMIIAHGGMVLFDPN